MRGCLRTQKNLTAVDFFTRAIPRSEFKKMLTTSDQQTVLIIEDDPNTAALVALYLERESFRVLTAGDGKTGLALAEQHRPDMVILDLMLPKMDGWEVCRRLRRFSDVPVIMLTARGEEVDRVAGLTLGADDYVVKPFSPRELVARVKAVLRRSSQPEPKRRRHSHTPMYSWILKSAGSGSKGGRCHSHRTNMPCSRRSCPPPVGILRATNC